MNVCSCTNENCKILRWCKRGLDIFQGEKIDFKFICNMETKYEYIILVEENAVAENK